MAPCPLKHVHWTAATNTLIFQSTRLLNGTIAVRYCLSGWLRVHWNMFIGQLRQTHLCINQHAFSMARVLPLELLATLTSARNFANVLFANNLVSPSALFPKTVQEPLQQYQRQRHHARSDSVYLCALSSSNLADWTSWQQYPGCPRRVQPGR